MAKMTTGQAVIESLVAQGVDTVFGIISIHTLHLYDALKTAVEGGRLKFVGARHEHALTFMADGYSRVTGKPGVLLTSSGPGAADSIGAMGESYHSSVPLLQITTEIESEWLGKGLGVTHEAKHQLEMFESVTDWRSLTPSVEEVPNQIAEAFDHLRTNHPRPAVLEIPTDYFSKESDFEIIPARTPAGPPLDAASLREAAELLRSAARPLVLAGAGVSRSDANAELIELAELLDIPVAVADGGKGAFPDDHRLGLGSALGQRIWHDNPVQEYIGTCDVVMVVGSSLPFRTTAGVQLKLPGKLIHVDVDPSVFGRNFPVKVGLPGDAKHVLRQLIDAVGDGSTGQGQTPGGERRDAIAALKQRTRAGLEEQLPNELRLWEGVRSAIGRDAIVICDSTVPASSATRCLPVYEPRSFHGPHGWVSIGYGFPASLGAKAGVPDRQVLCVTGDGGFQYNLQELGSAVQHGLAPIVLVFNDNAWGVLKGYQSTRMDDRFFATDLTNPDFETLAAAYGIDYALVRTTDELTSTLERIGNPSKITLVEAAVPDGIANFT